MPKPPAPPLVVKTVPTAVPIALARFSVEIGSPLDLDAKIVESLTTALFAEGGPVDQAASLFADLAAQVVAAHDPPLDAADYPVTVSR